MFTELSTTGLVLPVTLLVPTALPSLEPIVPSKSSSLCVYALPLALESSREAAFGGPPLLALLSLAAMFESPFDLPNFRVGLALVLTSVPECLCPRHLSSRHYVWSHFW